MEMMRKQACMYILAAGDKLLLKFFEVWDTYEIYCGVFENELIRFIAILYWFKCSRIIFDILGLWEHKSSGA